LESILNCLCRDATPRVLDVDEAVPNGRIHQVASHLGPVRSRDVDDGDSGRACHGSDRYPFDWAEGSGRNALVLVLIDPFDWAEGGGRNVCDGGRRLTRRDFTVLAGFAELGKSPIAVGANPRAQRPAEWAVF